MEHIGHSNNWDQINSEFRFTWNYFQDKQTYDYQNWCTHCSKLKLLFNQYSEVRWSCISYDFTVSCNNLSWVIDQLYVVDNKELFQSCTITRWLDGYGDSAITLHDLLKIT